MTQPRTQYNFTQSFQYNFATGEGATGVLYNTGIKLPKNAVVKALWIIVEETMTTTVINVGTDSSATSIFTSTTPIILTAGAVAEYLQGTGVNASGAVNISFGTDAVTEGSIIVMIDYTILS